MNGTAARFLRLGVSLSGLVILGWVLTGQAAKRANPGIPLPTDWSHSHLIFSRPGSAELLARVTEDPRYQQQIERREQALTLPASVGADAFTPAVLKANGKKLTGDWSEDLGSLVSVGPVLAGVYPAKYSFSSAVANCGSATKPDYVVYSTGLLGTTTQANIVAFDNLYSGCGVGVPTLYWAYNTAGQVLTSPVPSLDGTQVAFVQTDAGLAGTLVLLKWAAATGTIGSPATPTLVLPGAYSTCTVPCMTTITLRDSSHIVTNDTTSSVYYDYTNDIGWVGGDRGWLHKITGMFNGTPTEVTTGGFPAQVASTLPLSSPVYDRLSNNVFVGDQGGFLNSVNATSGAVTQSAQVDFGLGLLESPVVDTVNGSVYVFASSDGTGSCTLGADCAAVFQFPVTFSAGVLGAEVTVGNSTISGTNPNPLYIGGFDSAYYKSVNATGSLYVCGNTGGTPTLYQVPIVAGALPASGNSLSITPLASGTSTAACSSVTDVPNPNTTFGPSERMFVSVQSNGLPSACSPGGCVMNFVSAPWKASTTYAVGQQILSSKLHFETVITGGKSNATAPTWTSQAGLTKIDGAVVWIDQGVTMAGPLSIRQANHHYAFSNNRIIDSNNNVEVSTTPGTTAVGPPPLWKTTPGLTTSDGTVVWTNAGPIGTLALASAGGTSGIISDNAVGAGTLTGASQIYFTTLADQTCPTSGGSGGCAVQASQPALQ
jgi:hypothetical protein